MASYKSMLQFPNESDIHIGNDSYNMASLESFLRWEKLCEKTPKAPRMLLNGDPLDMTINKTLLNQSQPELSSIVWDNSSKHDSIFEFDSYPWHYNNQQTTQNDDEPMDWTLNKSDSDLNPTNWATSVKRNSGFGPCNSDNKMPEKNLVAKMIRLYTMKGARSRVLLRDLILSKSVNKMSGYNSEPDLSSDFSPKVSKSFGKSRNYMKDVCSDLRMISQRSFEQKYTDTSCTRIPASDSRSSAYFSKSPSFTANSYGESSYQMKMHGESMLDDESSVYSSINESSVKSYKLCDTLDAYNYRRQNRPAIRIEKARTPMKQVNRSSNNELSLHDGSLTSPIHISGAVTSSPLKMHGAKDTDNFSLENMEPDEFNDSLERVNYLLAMSGVKTPSPTRMKKRKIAIDEYVAELLKQEAMQPIAKPNQSPVPEVNTFFEDILMIIKSNSPINGTSVGYSTTDSVGTNLEATSDSFMATSTSGAFPTPMKLQRSVRANADIATRCKQLVKTSQLTYEKRKITKRTISVDQFLTIPK